jgi:hypothetical protein
MAGWEMIAKLRSLLTFSALCRLLHRQFLAELPDRQLLVFLQGYELEPVVEVQLIADNRPHPEERRVGRKRELQLHHAPHRDGLGHDSPESALGDNEATPANVKPLVSTKPKGHIWTHPDCKSLPVPTQ